MNRVSERTLSSKTGWAEPSKTSPHLNVDRSSSLCVRMAYRTANVVKRFGIGVAAACIVTPISLGSIFLAQKMELIQGTGDRLSLLKEGAAKLADLGIYLDTEALANPICPMEEYAKQWNRTFRNSPELQLTVFGLKASLFAFVVLAAPLCEEVIFRGLIQDVLLKRIPKYFVKKIAPGKETSLDSNISKVVRITLTAALFSAAHLSNSKIAADSYVSMNLIATFVLGIGCGVLKETKAGLLGAVGAHMNNNIFAISSTLWSC